MKKQDLRIATIAAALSLILMQFQNCSDVQFQSIEESGAGGLDFCDLNPTQCDELRSVNNSITVQPSTGAVDILFVVDNSGSMGPQIRELGDKFESFIMSLSGLDWQVCVTTTDIGRNDGKLLRFSNNEYWINANSDNPDQLFRRRMNDINDNGSGDERGIYAINRALERNEGCFRPGAALATVILSDEDERSTGGLDPKSDQFRVLDNYDFPNSVLANMAQLFNGKVYTNHSIIIRPAVPSLGFMNNDVACYNSQASENPAWYGTHYAELTRLTQGILGDVCADDYGEQLKFIGESIGDSLNSIPLECEPRNAKGNKITNAKSIIKNITPAFNTTATLAGNRLTFSPAIPAGRTINLQYYCLQ